MGTAITGQKQTAISKQRAKPSLNSLATMLAWLAQARQASLSKDTVKLYATELGDYLEQDVQAGIRRLGTTPRREGETAFPDLGTVLEAVRSARGARQRYQEAEERAAEFAAYQKDRAENPELYGRMEIVDSLNAAIERKGR